MHSIPTVPSWAPAVAVRLVSLGIRTVVRKKNGRVYIYRYLRFDGNIFPEVKTAKRVKLIIVPPDLTAPPIIITARRFQRGRRIHGFVVDSVYQRIVGDYARNEQLGVVIIEIIEPEKETKE